MADDSEDVIKGLQRYHLAPNTPEESNKELAYMATSIMEARAVITLMMVDKDGQPHIGVGAAGKGLDLVKILWAAPELLQDALRILEATAEGKMTEVSEKTPGRH